MNQARNCARCGAAVPSGGGVQGMCPRCLMELAALGPEPEPASSGPAPSPEALAEVFPRLELLRLVGRGGMGAVYEARQPELDRRIALKVLPAALAGDPAFAERFEREARTLARLDHPNIVRVHDAGRAGDWFYLAMEYVDGVDLRQMMRAGECTPRQALAIVAQLCDALQYAHDQGVVHRDIKPENVLVDRRGGVKVADFGLAKLLGRAEGSFQLTRSDQAMGTLHYMAPEQVERPLIVDHRADIYSLGVVLYELLTGELPIGHFPRPSDSVGVDARLDEVVLKTLEKEPARRYQQASEVKTAVGLAHAPDFATPAREEPGGEQPGEGEPESRRRPRLFRGRRERHAGQRAGHPAGHGLGWVLGCGCLFVVLAGAAGSLFLGVSHQRAAAVQEHSAMAAAEQAAARAVAAQKVGELIELDFHDERARLTSAAIQWLGVSEAERLEVEGWIAESRDAYLELERQHVTRADTVEGEVIWSIEPFPTQRSDLLGELRGGLIGALGSRRGEQFFEQAEYWGWRQIAPYGEFPCALRLRASGGRIYMRETVGMGQASISNPHDFEPPLPPRFRRFAP